MKVDGFAADKSGHMLVPICWDPLQVAVEVHFHV